MLSDTASTAPSVERSPKRSLWIAKLCCGSDDIDITAFESTVERPSPPATRSRRVSIPGGLQLDKLLPREFVAPGLPSKTVEESPKQQHPPPSLRLDPKPMTLQDYLRQQQLTCSSDLPKIAGWARRAAAVSTIDRVSLLHLKFLRDAEESAASDKSQRSRSDFDEISEEQPQAPIPPPLPTQVYTLKAARPITSARRVGLPRVALLQPEAIMTPFKATRQFGVGSSVAESPQTSFTSSSVDVVPRPSPRPSASYRRNSVEEYTDKFAQSISSIDLTSHQSLKEINASAFLSYTDSEQSVDLKGRSTDEPAQSTSEPARSSDEPARSTDEPVRVIDEPVRSKDQPVRVIDESPQSMSSRSHAVSEKGYKPSSTWKTSVSRRLLATQLRFDRRIPCDAVILRPGGKMCLVPNFYLTLASATSQLTIARGPQRRDYPIAELVSVDAGGTGCLERAKKASPAHLDWSGVESLEDEDRMVSLRYSDRKVPVVVVFENHEDQTDFLELINLGLEKQQQP